MGKSLEIKDDDERRGLKERRGLTLKTGVQDELDMRCPGISSRFRMERT